MPVRIHLLHTNDVHSELAAFARLVVPLRQLRDLLVAAGECVFTFDIGDHVDTSDPVTQATRGLVNADMLAAAGYDGWVFGNNESLTVAPADWPALLSHAHMPLLCSNLHHAGVTEQTREGQLYPCHGVTLGVFGVTVQYSKLHQAIGAGVADPVQEAWNRARTLREQGADLVVMLSHLGLREDQSLASAGLPVDVILGGHTHHFLDGGQLSGKTYICQAGKYAIAFGHTILEVALDRQPVLLSARSQLVYVDRTGPPDDLVQSVVRSHRAMADNALASPVATLADRLEHEVLGESLVVNLLCDQLRAETGADVAICIGGVVAGSFRAGVVRRRDILANCPTPMRAVVCDLTGQELRALVADSLHPSWAARQGFGYGFRGYCVGRLHVSGGRIVWNSGTRAGDGAGPVLHQFFVGHQLVFDDSVYRVALCEYIALGLYAHLFDEEGFRYNPGLLRDVLARGLADSSRVSGARSLRYETFGEVGR